MPLFPGCNLATQHPRHNIVTEQLTVVLVSPPAEKSVSHKQTSAMNQACFVSVVGAKIKFAYLWRMQNLESCLLS